MQTERELSERKAAILRALVQHYIRTGEPVGSEALVVHAGLSVSPATIRNELAALEEMGFLTQPHTSAGRAPTELAYRYYVDLLPPKPRLRDAERRAIVHFFDEALSDVDEILRGTTQLLSRLTHYASLALAPSPREVSIAQAELIRLGSATLLLVVFDTGQVEKRLVELPAETTPAAIEDASRTLADAVRGSTLGAARGAIRQRLEGTPKDRRPILEAAADVLAVIGEEAQAAHVVLGGVSSMSAQEVVVRRETLRQVFEALEREQGILKVLREATVSSPVHVVIGREHSEPEMWESSVIAAPYAAGGAIGTIGVVGPTRMDYAAAISAVRAVADRLSAAVDALAR